MCLSESLFSFHLPNSGLAHQAASIYNGTHTVMGFTIPKYHCTYESSKHHWLLLIATFFYMSCGVSCVP